MDLSYRKGTCKLRILHRDQTPLAYQRVKAEQVRHQFLFGCGAFETLKITSPENEAEKAFYTERMEKWQEIFNFATLPFYWKRYEPEQGRTLAKETEAAALWLKERGIILKGHPLCWHTQTAPWLLDMEPVDILKAQKERIKREVEYFKGLVDIWDVINEVVIMPVFDKEENGITKLCQDIGRVEIIRQMFEATRAYNPDAVLLLNDFNTSTAYEALIEECLEAGIRIDAIGIQSHQHQGYWGSEKLLNVLERFSRFGLPIHFTENTFISGQLMPPEIVDLNDYQIKKWSSTPEGEERQAQNIEEFYRILFENPRVEAITTWAFQDNAWLGAPAGLVREDNTRKPAFHALKRLVKEEWWTGESLTTDENGCVDLTGFLGDYTLSLQDADYPFTLAKDSKEILIYIE